MADKIIRYIPASELPGATPGEAGGIIALVVDDLGGEHPMTAAQYREHDFKKISALELWREVRFLRPVELHPDDFRKLYPEQASLQNNEIQEKLRQLDTRLYTTE